MFKRILAFALAACMMLDSASVTTFAAEPQTEVISVDETEEVDDTEIVTESEIIEDTASEEMGTEAETTIEEVENSEEEIITEEVVSSEEEAVTEEVIDSEEEETTEEADNSEEVVTTELEEVVIEEVKVETSSEKIEQATVTGTSAVVIGEVNEITLPAMVDDVEQYVYYTFTAPEDGVYHFNFTSPSSYEIYINVCKHKTGSDREYIAIGELYPGVELNLTTKCYLQAGESYWVELYTYAPEETTLSLTAKKLAEYSLTKQSDGTYTASTTEYIFAAEPEAGYENIRSSVSLAAKEGVTLAGGYYTYLYVQKAGGTLRKDTSAYIHSSDYTDEVVLQVQQGYDWNLNYVLLDSNKAPIAVFKMPEVLKTKETTEPYIIHGYEATENRITIDLEFLSKKGMATYSGGCHYGPTGSVSEIGDYISVTWERVEFPNLQPDTEYTFEFTDIFTNYLGSIAIRTEKNATTAQFDYELAENASSLQLEATVSGYKGTATTAYFYYQYTDLAGVVRQSYFTENIRNIAADADGSKNFTMSKVAEVILPAGVATDFTLWVEFSDATTDKTVLSVSRPANTEFSADDISFTVTGGADGTAEYAVSVADLQESKIAAIYYRQQGELFDNKNYKSFTVNADGYTGTLTGLQAGGTYDFILFVDGVTKEQTATIGTASVKLTAVGDVAVYPLDIAREFKVESAEELTGTYYLRMFIWDETKNTYTAWSGASTLNADNSYQLKYMTASSGKTLEPETEYKIKWTLSTSSSSSATPVYSIYETVKTTKVDITFTEDTIYYDGAQYNYTGNADQYSNFDSFSLRSYVYVRKAGTNSWHQSGSQILASNYNTDGYLLLWNLEPETTYEVSIRSNQSDDYTEFGKLSFTTKADTRKVELTSIAPALTNALFTYQLSGMDVIRGSERCAVFIRKANTTDEWEFAGGTGEIKPDGEMSGTLRVERYQNEPLEENTTYEYRFGIGETGYTTNEIEIELSGTFTTEKDTREVKVTSKEIRYHSATLNYELSGTEVAPYSCVHLYVREKGTGEWQHVTFRMVSSSTGTFEIEKHNDLPLKDNTTYEYKFGFAEDWTGDSLKNELIGEFTTVEDTRQLSVTISEGSTKAKVTANVTGNNTSVKGTIRCFYKKQGSEEWLTTLVSSTDQYVDHEYALYIDGLESQTTYDYIVLLAEGHIPNDISYIKDTDKKVTGQFTTTEADPPTELDLGISKYQFILTGKQTASKTFVVTAKPEDASAEVIWSSSNEKVVTVEDGVVVAKAPGVATITVASKLDPSVTTTCEITVKKYLVGRINESNEIEFIDTEKEFNLAKGSSISGFGYYEIFADGTSKKLDKATVSFSDPNVVTYTNGMIQAVGTGHTYVIFAADGVQSKISVYSTIKATAYGLTGIDSSNNAYPAIKNEGEGLSYTLVHFEGVTYRAIVETSPVQSVFEFEYSWVSSDPTVATVDGNGNITPLKPGTTTLTITYNGEKDKVAFNQDPVEVELIVKGLPVEGNEKTIYTIATKKNKTIGDVAFPASWGEGWSWKYPATPLVTNGENKDAYNFEAVYTGENGYPAETTVQVYIAQITGISVNEVVGENAIAHKNVIETTDSEGMKLAIGAIAQGELNPSGEGYEIEVPAAKNLNITKNQDGTYTIKAEKAGNYTLKPQVVVDGTVVAKGSYKFTVVDVKQVDKILLTTDTELKNGKVILELSDVEAKKAFTLTAAAKDRTGADYPDAKLKWTTSDKSVVTVTQDKTDKGKAIVTVKGEGHAIVTVTANDKVKTTASISIEVQNHKPRISTNKTTVNTAYDYTSSAGRTLASAAGLVEIVPVYGETITSYELFAKDGITKETNLKIEKCTVYGDYGYGDYMYLISPAPETPDIDAKNYECTLKVTTNTGGSYDYPIKVSVVNKKPTVKASMSGKINLFYTNSTGQINLNISNKAYIENSSVVWEDTSAGTNNGFIMTGTGYTSGSKSTSYLIVQQQRDISLVNGKLQDEGIAKGTITVQLHGYRGTYTINNVAVKYEYKKPSLVTKNANTTVCPDLGQNGNSFYLYNKTHKFNISYYENPAYSNQVNEIACNDNTVSITKSEGSMWLNYRYTGKETTKKITLTVNSPTWREPLQAIHTIKVKSPKVRLQNSTITFNTYHNNKANAYASISQDNGLYAAFTKVEVKASNGKAQQLLDNNLLLIDANQGGSIEVIQNNAAIMGKTIPAGSYNYKVTPYYMNSQTGTEKALNTLTLTVKILNKPVTASVSPKGTIDIAYGTYYDVTKKVNAVWVDAKYTNLPTNDLELDRKLVGEYSDYFVLDYDGSTGHYFITVNEENLSKLKAGQAYKLAIEYTIWSSDGNRYEVTSKTFTIKPKQSKPKITISNNNQTLYAGADSVSRIYYLQVPNGYTISAAYGSYDCNKDGKADITVIPSSYYGNGCELIVRIIDPDAVGASASGKSYTIPVTVKVVGTDGITKDATTNIKVKVKR